MAKQVPVKPHLRKGKPVAGHKRIVADTTPLSATKETAPGDLTDLSGDDAAKTLVGGMLRGETITFEEFGAPGGLGSYRRFEGCVFEDVTFKSIDLSDKEFVDCKFHHCTLRDIGFSNGLIQNCTFTKTEFMGTRYSAHWDKIKIVGCEFEDGQMNVVRMKDAEVNNCTFRSFDVGGVSRWNDTNITDSRFYNMSLGHSDVCGSVFDRCTFSDVKLTALGRWVTPRGKGSKLAEFGASNWSIRDSELSNCTINKGRMTDSDLSGCTLSNCSLEYQDFQNLNLTGTKAKNVRFRSCKLRNARFDDVDFKKVMFERAFMHNTWWNGATVDCEFSGEENRLLYQKHSFESTLNASGLSSSEFEFLVLSGVIEARDNETLAKVTSGFHVDRHHVPPWAFQNLHRLPPVDLDSA